MNIQANFSNDTDVVIIGAGPVGLFAAFECGMVGLRSIIVDALDHPGGQCSALYPQKPIYDIAGYPSILAQDLVDNLLRQIEPFGVRILLGKQVVGLSPVDDTLPTDERIPSPWTVALKDHANNAQTHIKAKAVIIAAGVGAFGPNKPPIPHLSDFEATSIFYHVRNPKQFEGKRVVIAGGGDSAIDWALVLKDIAAKTYVVHRRPKFRAAQASMDRFLGSVQAQEIELVTPFQLHSLKGDHGVLSHVVVESLDGGQKELGADVLLPFFGLSMELGPMLSWGLGLDRKHIMIDQGTCRTNKAGIYAVGDIATYAHKLKLILTGFAEGAQAAHDIRHLLHPDEVFHFEYSTTKGVGGNAG
jgi:thioredoxin reductase (NADPH)